MRVTLHDYVTDPSLPQKDGVNLAHENIASLLRRAHREGLQVTFHDFHRLASDQGYAREVLSNTDCVVSNVGPHAHYYFYLRDQLGLDFRIVRDVRTAIWSSYLFQEHLCGPYLRESDALLVASDYTRGIYEKMFPHLASLSIVRCYPMTVGFPARMPPRASRPDGLEGALFTLGYIGRLSEDKNFPDVVELLVFLNQRHPGRYRLLACGDIHSPSCHPQQVREYLADSLGGGDFFEYLPPRVNGEIWELYRRFDAMVFPTRIIHE
jgi:glycosyltransferase involved in cell wall biosynthesis